MKFIIFWAILFQITSFAAKAGPDVEESLFGASSALFLTDITIRGSTGYALLNPGNPMGDIIFPKIKQEWQKSVRKNFTETEVKYLNDLFKSNLMKRYFQHQKDFSAQTNLTKIVNDSFSLIEKPPAVNSNK